MAALLLGWMPDFSRNKRSWLIKGRRERNDRREVRQRSVVVVDRANPGQKQVSGERATQRGFDSLSPVTEARMSCR